LNNTPIKVAWGEREITKKAIFRNAKRRKSFKLLISKLS